MEWQETALMQWNKTGKENTLANICYTLVLKENYRAITFYASGLRVDDSQNYKIGDQTKSLGKESQNIGIRTHPVGKITCSQSTRVSS